MSDHLVFWVGNRNPSISDTITSNGAVVDLTGKSVRFKAREVGSSTLLVDQPVSNTPDNTGAVRYDWSAGDITAPNGILSKARRAVVVWWEVTSGAKTQDVGEAVIEVRAHSPQAITYVELEDFKSTKELKGTTFADQDIEEALEAASRAVDSETDRRFYLDADATQVRYYDARWRDLEVAIDDLVALTELATDQDGDGTYETIWTQGTDFTLEPRNAPSDGKPYKSIRILIRTGRRRFPDGDYYPDSIRVTGQFGWAAVPANVRIATKLLAARLLKLNREGAFGVAGFGADGVAVRISRSLPDFDTLLAPYRRRRLFM